MGKEPLCLGDLIQAHYAMTQDKQLEEARTTLYLMGAWMKTQRRLWVESGEEAVRASLPQQFIVLFELAAEDFTKPILAIDAFFAQYPPTSPASSGVTETAPEAAPGSGVGGRDAICGGPPRSPDAPP